MTTNTWSSNGLEFLQEYCKTAPKAANVNLWTLHPDGSKESITIPVEELIAATDETALHCDGLNVFFNIGLTNKTFENGRRASATDICCLPGFYADIDIGSSKPGREHEFPKDEHDALDFIAAVDVPKPTLLVRSGSGLHAYWLFETAFFITDDETRKRATRCIGGFQSRFRELAVDKRGWKLDSIGDLARIGRLPGSFNLKRSPVQVTWRRYDV